MDLHVPLPKWNIIFLIYAELADAATIDADRDDYQANIKADLAQLKKTILNIDLTADFNVFTIENVVKITNGSITSDATFIRMLAFNPDKKRNRRKLLRKSKNENFDQKSGDIEGVFRHIDENCSAEKNLLVTWDHGSAFGIFKKSLSDHSSASPASNPGSPVSVPGAPPIIVPGGRPVTVTDATNSKFQFLSERPGSAGASSIISVRNKQFERPAFLSQSVQNDEDQTPDFALLSDDSLASAISNGFKNKYVDVLLMFNCDMQNMHTCFSLRDSVKYLVAAEGDMAAPGYDYLAIVNLIRSNKKANGNDVAAEAIKTFQENYKRHHRTSAIGQIAIFAVCLEQYETKLIQPMKSFIKTLAGMMDNSTAVIEKLNTVRQNSYSFAANLDYFLVDLNNFMQDVNEKSDDVQLKKLQEVLNDAWNSVLVGSAIGHAVYADGPATSEYKEHRIATGLSIYFPPRLQENDTPVMENFILPHAPFSTSLLHDLNWMGFLYKLYKNPGK